jgi:hypothetical protein
LRWLLQKCVCEFQEKEVKKGRIPEKTTFPTTFTRIPFEGESPEVIDSVFCGKSRLLLENKEE